MVRVPKAQNNFRATELRGFPASKMVAWPLAYSVPTIKVTDFAVSAVSKRKNGFREETEGVLSNMCMMWFHFLKQGRSVQNWQYLGQDCYVSLGQEIQEGMEPFLELD